MNKKVNLTPEQLEFLSLWSQWGIKMLCVCMPLQAHNKSLLLSN